MAYRREQSGRVLRARNQEEGGQGEEESPPASSLAAKAIRASSSSAATRDSSLSSAYAHHSFPKPKPPADVSLPSPSSTSFIRKDKVSYQYTSMDSLSEPKHGFWSTLARKAKTLIEDDPVDHTRGPDVEADKFRPEVTFGSEPYYKPSESSETESHRRKDGVMLQKGLGAISSSLNFIGGTIGNAFEEGLTKVENRTADIIHETRKLQSRKKSNRDLHKQRVNDGDANQDLTQTQTHHQPQRQTSWDIQLKASRDVAMAMAAKTKLLLRELKTVKADLAFAKERCAQLEEENKILRESMGKGDSPEDDDLVRLQLETLLAEKARLAHENSVYARENRFLREIVEYHQLTMQDVIYIDERKEEVSEVYPKMPGGTDLPTVASMMPPTSPSASEPSGTPHVI